MKRERLYRVAIQGLPAVTVDYYLTIDDSAEEKYGVCLVKTTDRVLIEEFVSIDHISRDSYEMRALIARLAKGEVLPITLADIIDDYLITRELL